MTRFQSELSFDSASVGYSQQNVSLNSLSLALVLLETFPLTETGAPKLNKLSVGKVLNPLIFS